MRSSCSLQYESVTIWYSARSWRSYWRMYISFQMHVERLIEPTREQLWPLHTHTKRQWMLNLMSVFDFSSGMLSPKFLFLSVFIIHNCIHILHFEYSMMARALKSRSRCTVLHPLRRGQYGSCETLNTTFRRISFSDCDFNLQQWTQVRFNIIVNTGLINIIYDMRMNCELPWLVRSSHAIIGG